MNAEELLKRLTEYGADPDGIADRFGDNIALYEKCFRDFLRSPELTVLDEALLARDYARAFDAAHSLKGLSGNLGLIACYVAVCALVEALRSNNYAAVPGKYEEMKRELERLETIASGGQPGGQQNTQDKSCGARAGNKKRRDTFLMGTVAAVAAVFVIAGIFFWGIRKNYSEKTEVESGQLLLETGKQISMYIEEQIANDWRIAHSIGKIIKNGSYYGDDELFLAALREQQDSWNVTDIMLYTDNGYCVYTDGRTEANGTASKTIAQAYANGRALSIIESRIIYTLPIDTDRTYNGSRIAAVSVVRGMESLIDEMDFTSFDDQAWIYLTEENGIVVSMLTRNNAEVTFNINTVFEGGQITLLTGTQPNTDVFAKRPETFLMRNEADEKYIVSVPIYVDENNTQLMRLFYMVPETVVNGTTNIFSRQLTVFSSVIIVMLMGIAVFALIVIYRSRKREFDAAIVAREQMLNLLIKNIRTVFGLFSANGGAPLYISANAPTVLGDEYWTVEKYGAGYRARTASDKKTNMLREANALLKDWDGRSVFRSGYICDDTAVTPAYFEIILYPAGEEGGDIVGIIQDVTAVHEREKVTRDALEMAKRSNEAKTRFLSNMSHDIRTPMNAIMNMSVFALETANEPRKHAEYLSTIYESSKHLLHLLNDVLDMSRIESGQTAVASEPFDIRAELMKQADTVRPLCAAKKQTLIVELGGIGADTVRGDSLKVSQVAMNLLSNAVKFTPEGGAVRFTATQLQSLRADTVNIRFCVEDNGIGISEEYIRHIFEPFSRANDERVNDIEGTGLGLSICKSYVDAMGGTISIQSEEGEGSTFTVELAFERAGTRAEEKPAVNVGSNTPFIGLRCLVVEDIPTNQLIAKTMLEKLGFMVDTAADGSEGVARFQRSGKGTYDVIYMDIQMPRMDGYQAAVHIRAGGHPQAKTIPILAMSANVFTEDIEKARIAGMDGYIGKPIVTMELIEQTVKAIQTKKGQQP